MHHTVARVVIAQLLQHSGFGERGLALATAAGLGDADQGARELREAALERAIAMPCTTTACYSGPLAYAPVPADERQLCDQLCPLLINQARDIGMQLSCLSALVTLWPHVASDERVALRKRFLDGLEAEEMPSAAKVTSSQLRAWQRDLPTAINETSPSLSSLRAMLDETEPQRANRVLAEHLGMNADLPTLSWVLGALTVQLRLQLQDPDGHLLHALLGTVACESLSTWVAPELLHTLIAQLGHQIWWCRQQAHLPPVRICLDLVPRQLEVAVMAGDMTIAQRAARAVAKQPGEFWETTWKMLGQRISQADALWTRAMHICVAISWRTSSDAISPDDAAAVGTVFADLAYRQRMTEKRAPELATH